MQRQDFAYSLPEDLIAQHPTAQRDASRLLVLDGQPPQCVDARFRDLTDWLKPGDLLVFNNTRVIPGRLYGQKASGGAVELLLERLLDDNRALVHLRANRAPKIGASLRFDRATATVVARHDAMFELAFEVPGSLLAYFREHGHMPLPPYIRRDDQAEDQDRYQSILGKNEGAVAAPTASLHFDDAMLERLRAAGIDRTEITLHVGAGTFLPVRVDDVNAHIMHSEVVDVPPSAVAAIEACRARGGRVVAIGTTVVRSLEAAAEGGTLAPMQGETRLFIRPGFTFRVVDALLTNFHLPESTLLMLVSAFAGYSATMAAYKHAVAERYRFFSYGDAMLLTQRCKPEEAMP